MIVSPNSRRAHRASRLRCLLLAVTALRTSATTNCECPVSDSAALITSTHSSGSPPAISRYSSDANASATYVLTRASSQVLGVVSR
ncbi:Uncharacterised protein [Mycobacterium tuberculosis]|nr:Uncharacterised protein [Mycobacterium tuberculosis]